MWTTALPLCLAVSVPLDELFLCSPSNTSWTLQNSFWMCRRTSSLCKHTDKVIWERELLCLEPIEREDHGSKVTHTFFSGRNVCWAILFSVFLSTNEHIQSFLLWCRQSSKREISDQNMNKKTHVVNSHSRCSRYLSGTCSPALLRSAAPRDPHEWHWPRPLMLQTPYEWWLAPEWDTSSHTQQVQYLWKTKSKHNMLQRKVLFTACSAETYTGGLGEFPSDVDQLVLQSVLFVVQLFNGQRRVMIQLHLLMCPNQRLL